MFVFFASRLGIVGSSAVSLLMTLILRRIFKVICAITRVGHPGPIRLHRLPGS